MSTPIRAAPGGGEGPKKEWTVLKAVEFVLAKPEIKNETDAILKKYRKRYEDARDEEDIKEIVANKVIKNYSYITAFTGGTTALAGVVPGIGTVASVAGGVTVYIALCMKFQVEMVMSLAHIYDHDIMSEEGRRLCFIIAGLGAINQATQKVAKEVGLKAFTKMFQKYLQGSTLVAVKVLLKRVWRRLSNWGGCHHRFHSQQDFNMVHWRQSQRLFPSELKCEQGGATNGYLRHALCSVASRPAWTGPRAAGGDLGRIPLHTSDNAWASLANLTPAAKSMTRCKPSQMV